MRITFENTTNAPLQLDLPISDLAGTAIVEIKRPGEHDFTPLRTHLSGLDCIAFYHSNVAPGERYAAYVLVLTDWYSNWVLEKPGRYELRGRVIYRDAQVRSQPLTVTVRPLSPDADAKLEALHADVCQLSLMSGLPQDLLTRLATELAQIRGYQDTLIWARAIMYIPPHNDQLRESCDAQQLRLTRTRQRLWREVATAELALRYASDHKSGAAERLLASMPHRTTNTDDARLLLNEEYAGVRPE